MLETDDTLRWRALLSSLFRGDPGAAFEGVTPAANAVRELEGLNWPFGTAGELLSVPESVLC